MIWVIFLGACTVLGQREMEARYLVSGKKNQETEREKRGKERN